MSVNYQKVGTEKGWATSWQPDTIHPSYARARRANVGYGVLKTVVEGVGLGTIARTIGRIDERFFSGRRARAAEAAQLAVMASTLPEVQPAVAVEPQTMGQVAPVEAELVAVGAGTQESLPEQV